MGTNAADADTPPASLDDVDVRPFFGDRVTNGGVVALALSKFGASVYTYVQAEVVTVIAGGYQLTSLQWGGAAQTRSGRRLEYGCRQRAALCVGYRGSRGQVRQPDGPGGPRNRPLGQL